MKTRIRFSLHFITGTLLCLLTMGITAMFSIEFLLPQFGIAENDRYYDLIVITIFFIHLLACSILFSFYFVRPLWFIVSWIANLTQGVYEPPGTKNKIYNTKNDLRKPFRLYEEVIINVHQLSNVLKQAEGERARLEASKRSWIAGISHDLKTPLTSVIGYSTLLLNKEYVWSQEDIYNFAEVIRSKGQYIEDLIGDLNISTQIGAEETQIPLRKEEVNIVDFVRRLIAAVANDSRADGYELSFYSEDEDITLRIDQKLMYRALMNLLVNTIEHNPVGTGIQVTMKKQGQSVELKIIDNGIGMGQSTLDSLFSEHKNAAADRPGQFGTGLGMSIARKLIAAHGGDLTVESKPSEGTVFYTTFPL